MYHVMRAIATGASTSCHHRSNTCIAARATWLHYTSDGTTDNAATGTTSIRCTAVVTSSAHLPGATGPHCSISTAGQWPYATYRWSGLTNKIKLQQCEEP